MAMTMHPPTARYARPGHVHHHMLSHVAFVCLTSVMSHSCCTAIMPQCDNNRMPFMPAQLMPGKLMPQVHPGCGRTSHGLLPQPLTLACSNTYSATALISSSSSRSSHAGMAPFPLLTCSSGACTCHGHCVGHVTVWNSYMLLTYYEGAGIIATNCMLRCYQIIWCIYVCI